MINLIEYPIAICGKRPDWYTDSGRPSYPKLAPKIGFFKDWKAGIIDNEGYVKEYIRQVLSDLNPHQVYSELLSIYPNVDENKIMLLCYERPGEFCHRNLVASWFRTNGLSCEEFKP